MHDKPAAMILAAGLGKRMQSALPKVLHPCLDLPLVCHVVRLSLTVGCDPIVVVVSPSTAEGIEQAVRHHFPHAPVRFAVQHKAQGTGDAARCGLTGLGDFEGRIFVLYGDVPLLTAQTLEMMQLKMGEAPLAVLTAHVDSPFGYGRVVRDARGLVQEIVEQKDCTGAQQKISEINAGVYWVDSGLLRRTVAQLTTENAQGEYYLTDCVKVAAAAGGAVGVPVTDVDEVRGVNGRRELAVAEQLLRKRIVGMHQENGVTFHDVDGTFVGVDVEIGRDVDIGMGVQLHGKTRIAQGAIIEGPTVIIDSVIGAHAVVHHFSHLEQATVEGACSVGPYARLRPEAHLEENARVGNFVEIKKSRLRAGAKVNHLSYVGDADVGPKTNIGAGTITCNYDGFGKHRTVLGASVFVGSNSTLVAPLTLADGVFVAAGSTVTDAAPKDSLIFGRAKQVNREGYAQKLRERLQTQSKKREP